MTCGVKTILREVHAEIWPQRIGKVGMVEQIVEIDPELDSKPLIDPGVFGQAEIKILEVRPDKGITAKAAEMLIAVAAVKRGVDVAWHPESCEIQDLVRRFCSGKWIAHQVRTAEELL